MSDPRHPDDPTPSLGALRDLELAASPRRDPAPRPPRRGLPLVLAGAVLAVVIVVIAALVVWREPLGQRLVPETPLSRQLETAQAALARRELSRPDGQGARELFQAVLAVDPDHLAARSGLAAVRDAALADAAAALDRGDREGARRAVALATELSAPASALHPLETRLRAGESSARDLEAALSTAQAMARAGDEEAALAAYARVLADQPANALALEGRRELLTAWLGKASSALGRGDVDEAARQVARVVEIDPSHLDLPAAQARLGEALAQRQRLRERELEQAERDLQSGRLEAAAGRYATLLSATPDFVEARAGLERCATIAARRASRLAGDFEFDAAERALGQARAWAPGVAAIAQAEQRLRQARVASGRLDSGSAADPGDLAALLSEAETAMRRGELLEPPGDSAWDKLRAAAALSPRDPSVRRALQDFDRRARECLDSEMLGNRLSAAEACLDALALRSPAAALASDRRRLAQRWLALASERIGQNEPALARRALVSARRLDPALPELPVLEQRLQQVLEARL